MLELPLRVALAQVGGLLVLVAGHVDAGLGEPEVLVHRVPAALQAVHLRLGLRDLGPALPLLLAPLGDEVVQLLPPRRVHLPEGLLDLLPGQLDLEVVEPGLVGLPFAVVVHPHHQGEGDQEADGGESEHDVHLECPLSHLRVTAGLDLGRGHIPSATNL
ncbi:MAG: hypothetical protein DMF79_19490 [Acidobacteria bacterium]|nr:MAG: hypothetical protein DMF79_19490 [Acidobacteriota bacterium]